MEKTVATLNLKDSVALPQVVILPTGISNALGIPRRVYIDSRAMSLPKTARDWIARDPRYSKWLADGKSAATDQTESQSVEEEAGVTEESWSEDMTAPQLKTFAKGHDIAITFGSNRQQVIDALREAAPELEVS